MFNTFRKSILGSELFFLVIICRVIQFSCCVNLIQFSCIDQRFDTTPVNSHPDVHVAFHTPVGTPRIAHYININRFIHQFVMILKKNKKIIPIQYSTPPTSDPVGLTGGAAARTTGGRGKSFVVPSSWYDVVMPQPIMFNP